MQLFSAGGRTPIREVSQPHLWEGRISDLWLFSANSSGKELSGNMTVHDVGQALLVPPLLTGMVIAKHVWNSLMELIAI